MDIIKVVTGGNCMSSYLNRETYGKTKCSFVILIDEWDCLFREFQ